MENASSRTLFHSNPVLSRLSRVTERTDGSTATYAGIASKTAFFLLITLFGVVAQLVAKVLFASAPAWQTITVYDNFALTLTKPEAMIVGVISVVGLIAELIGIFLRKTVPVSGTIYAASQGYVISFLVFNVLAGYEYLGLEALLLTDIHIRVTQDSGEMLAFDDDDQEITRCVVEQWIENKDENFYDQVLLILRNQLKRHRNTVDNLGILKPFSIVLENDDKENIGELYLADDDTIIVSGDLMEGLDKELDDFFKDLMK